MSEIYIFGAHSRARTTAKYITTRKPTTTVAGFLVNNDELNPISINGVPVIDISKKCELQTDYTVYIGTRGVYWEDITSMLREKGFTDIRPVDVALDLKLRNEFMKIEFERRKQNFVKFDSLMEDKDNGTLSSVIFSMASANDGVLTDSYEMKNYEEIMQVGSSIAEKRLTTVLGKNVNFFDDMADDTISSLNKQFCELTGLYAVWKMDKLQYDYVGVCHYRRHFMIPDSWVSTAEHNKVDVILPVPLYVDPSLDENYRARHVSSDLDFVYSYIKSEYYFMSEQFEEFMSRGIYSPCNMLIARPDIINELCEWMFPILFALHNKVGTREDKYQNRYPGFISERLISFYFEFYSDRLIRVYADKNFLS